MSTVLLTSEPQHDGGFFPVLHVDHQSFSFGMKTDTVEEADWYCRQMRTALERAGCRVQQQNDQASNDRKGSASCGRYSSKLPAKPGWWWVKRENKDMVVPVWEQRAFGGRLCAFIPGKGWYPVEEVVVDGWSGPITPPVEQCKEHEWQPYVKMRGMIRGRLCRSCGADEKNKEINP